MDGEQLERAVHAAVNDARTARDYETVAYDPDLQPVARYHSSRMASGGELFHEAPDGEELSDRLAKFGYDLRAKSTGQRFCHGCCADLRCLLTPQFCPECGSTLYDVDTGPATAGENLALQESTVLHGAIEDERSTAVAVVEGWLDSPDHRKNLLDARFDREAIGTVVDSGATVAIYITQVLS